MESRRSFLIVFVVLAVLGMVAGAFAQERPQQPFLVPAPTGPPPSDEVVVQFGIRVPAERIVAIHRAVGTTVIHEAPVVGGTLYVVRTPACDTPAAAAARYRRFKEVASAEPNDAGYRPQPRRQRRSEDK